MCWGAEGGRERVGGGGGRGISSCMWAVATHRHIFGVLAVPQLAMGVDAKGPQAAALCTQGGSCC